MGSIHTGRMASPSSPVRVSAHVLTSKRQRWIHPSHPFTQYQIPLEDDSSSLKKKKGASSISSGLDRSGMPLTPLFSQSFTRDPDRKWDSDSAHLHLKSKRKGSPATWFVPPIPGVDLDLPRTLCTKLYPYHGIQVPCSRVRTKNGSKYILEPKRKLCILHGSCIFFVYSLSGRRTESLAIARGRGLFFVLRCCTVVQLVFHGSFRRQASLPHNDRCVLPPQTFFRCTGAAAVPWFGPTVRQGPSRSVGEASHVPYQHHRRQCASCFREGLNLWPMAGGVCVVYIFVNCTEVT